MIALVPVYNHAATVGQVCAELLALGAPVLVVDDGSDDGSGEAARQTGAEVLTHPDNQGKAAALQTGFASCQQRGYEQVLTIDADGQHPLAMAQAVVAAATEQPLALTLGVRDMAPAPLRSRLGRWWSNTGASIVSGGQRFGDTQTGLRVYPLPATTALAVTAHRYAYEIEVLVRAVWHGVPILHVPVTVDYPEQRISHFRVVADTARALSVLLRLAWLRCLPGWRSRHVRPGQPTPRPAVTDY